MAVDPTPDGKTRTHEGVIIPNETLRKIEEECGANTDEYKRRVKEAGDALVKMGGAGKMRVKYRLYRKDEQGNGDGQK